MTDSRDWLAADWPGPASVVGGCTTRVGGVSQGVYASLNLGAHVGDTADAVAENRRRFRESCRLPGDPVWLQQVHGSNVAVDPAPGIAPETDAIVSRRANVVCAVMTADCLPVLLVSRDGREIGAIHAGWRGLAQGVVEATIGAFSTPAGQLLAWFGPAISQDNFEVGGEVRDRFVAGEQADAACFARNGRGRWQADLFELARRRLFRAGVAAVYGGDICTYQDAERFFSYRRDGQCGRMATFIFRRQ